MVKKLLPLLLLPFTANAVTVLGVGYGSSCEETLLSAKNNALERGVGTWINSSKKFKNGSYDEDIVQYSGGVIKSYEVLENDCRTAVIEAEVLKRSNRVQSFTVRLPISVVEHVKGIKDSNDRKENAIRELDNPASAVYFSPDDMEVIVKGDEAIVKISGEFRFTDKWKSDYKDLKEMFGDFNLPSFSYTPNVTVNGYSDGGDVVFSQVIQGSFKYGTDKWNLFGPDYSQWSIENPSSYINPNETDSMSVYSSVPIEDIDLIETFKVELSYKL